MAAMISVRRLVLTLALDMLCQAILTLAALTAWTVHNHGVTVFSGIMALASTANIAGDLSRWRDR
jgi:hypothetical protein